MISLINKLIILIILNTMVFSESLEYRQDGKYRILSNKHLINDVKYKKGNLYQILVEIPTGSRQKWEVNHKSGHLEWTFQNGKPRKVNFLGYPGNYGFIPQTLSGDGDALDIIVLSENVKRGDILNVKVIGMLKLMDREEHDNKVIAIINDGIFKNINSLEEMLLIKPNVITIIKTWFEGYKDLGKMVFMGYENRERTIEYIEQSHINWSKRK